MEPPLNFICATILQMTTRPGKNQMRNEDEKGRPEIKIFSCFTKFSELPIDPRSIEKHQPPEPDILCLIKGEGLVAFELAELCDSDIARNMNKAAKEDHNQFTWASNSSKEIIRRKLQRQYRTDHPIELLCYIDGRDGSTAGMILPQIRPILDSRKGCEGPFRRVWLLDDVDKVHHVWARP